MQLSDLNDDEIKIEGLTLLGTIIIIYFSSYCSDSSGTNIQQKQDMTNAQTA
jgi:hypothetical protein